MTPLTAKTALDRSYLETRCKLIEIAANLDRIERGAEAGAAVSDPRLKLIREGLALLNRTDISTADRAERVQKLFSQEYEQTWSAPNAK
ncbi:MAG: hypothetical protein IPK83_15955 [Planctomycetes bacterium]|nr:hypothetical protein [Planctomycetota bacterium]